jgi:putative CocE/NonD family hydrolase
LDELRANGEKSRYSGLDFEGKAVDAQVLAYLDEHVKGIAPEHGPDDYLGVESRGDVLTYTTDPLTEPVELIGAVTMVVHVDTSAADTDITAKLVDVHPGGFVQRLCDGMVRLRYRDGFHRQRSVTPGEVYEVEIAMWDTCVRLPAGHRLRVEIASSAFPKYDVNLGTGGDMITETEGVLASNRLWHTPSRPSRLILPVVSVVQESGRL